MYKKKKITTNFLQLPLTAFPFVDTADSEVLWS